MKFEKTMERMNKEVWYWGMALGITGYPLSLHYNSASGTFFAAILLSLMLSFTADRLANSK